ncbi:hypothetical protein [Chryseobacterium sp. ISL-6]|uniref:hypothetical protein n=1 Tax=Chryseobacterium sp. ISL-6 TaxID=2819143 RepID=UPI001BE8F68B|nr:hypothetical protein [Chryseobacterium sp. ISL-6]MBT2622374.1 hypothetical protein [Chryseobacterium sp. ISL-6]
MKKISIILGLSSGLAIFAQNNPIDGTENIHIFNDKANHTLELHYTLFTVNPTTCGGGFQAQGPSIILPPGGLTDYKTFESSTTAAAHPYPIDNWFNGNIIPAASITPAMAYNERWAYMKFQLRDPQNPGNIPLLSGSVGYYQNCTGAQPHISDSGTLNGVTYSFFAEAFTVGTDLWINVQ